MLCLDKGKNSSIARSPETDCWNKNNEDYCYIIVIYLVTGFLVRCDCIFPITELFFSRVLIISLVGGNTWR